MKQENFRPLFPDESERTHHFRRVIIRKTLQLVRDNPNMGDDELITLAEREAEQVCDLCVESSFEGQPNRLVGRYFLKEGDNSRKDHVGRFFLHRLEPLMEKKIGREHVFPVLARSVLNLLGQEVYDTYSDRAARLVRQFSQKGLIYNDILECEPAQKLMRELIAHYKAEMGKSPAFQDQLKTQIDEALLKYLSRNPFLTLDIDLSVEILYRDFLNALRASAGAGV